MTRNANTLLILLVSAALVIFGTTSSRAQSVSVSPIDYRVGPVPAEYQPAIYTQYPYTLGSIPDISDSSLSTYTHLQGLDDIVQSNGYHADTGTFYLLQFQIDPNAVSFRIDFTASADFYPFTPDGDFIIDAVAADGGDEHDVALGISARQPTTFGMTFTRTGNSGSSAPSYGLDYMLDPQGRLRVALTGDFLAALDQPGSVSTYLYDVTASYTVPEPSSMIFAAAALTILTLRPRTSRNRTLLPRIL